MLRTLEVENLSVLQAVAVEFGAGLNVLSGETGAGKSLLLDALQLALGARGGAELVRTGCRSARVSALFVVAADAPCLPALADLGVAPDEGAVLLTRDLGADGRSACRINGRIATQGVLRQVGQCLLAVVGQGDHYRFAAPAGQLAFLDGYGGTDLLAVRAQVATLHAAWSAECRAAAAEGSAEQRLSRREAMRQQLTEIDAVGPRQGEEDALRQRRQVLSHAERLSAGVQRALDVLREGEDATGDRLGALHRELEGLARLDPAVGEAAALIEQASIAVDEACHVLGRYRDGLRFDPAEVQAMEDRWGALQRLKRKYGDSLQAVLDQRAALAADLAALDDAEALAASRAEQTERLAVQLAAAARSLGALRAQAASRLEAEVGNELARLGMAGARFRAVLTSEEDRHGVAQGDQRLACGPGGMERAEFLWSANPGLALAPLARAASGGELSRLLLALHALRAAEVDVPTIVFDEIDAGIGGQAAAAVADRLQRLGEDRQVLCVTHQAVIAAAADQHFAIAKVQEGTGVSTSVRPLRGVERTIEVARMLDGGEGPTSRAHALEMLERLVRGAVRGAPPT